MPRLSVLECSTPLSGSTLTAVQAAELESLLRALADRHRLRIVNMLLQAKKQAVCVCEFTPALSVSQPTVSYHLKQLTEAGLVERERRGSFAYYRLVDGALDRLSALIGASGQA
jgi:ArsR family transcriptional regulator